ncbi:MAG: O-antigen ligase family protein, partial [Candidatus Omnitrophica bacterium]|nr:O-antigen ligase family protein [Candidatus Omnitrophota bacterium]
MIIHLSIAYSLTGTSRSLRYLVIFMATVMTLALFLCLSRAGIISFFLSAFLLLFLLRAKKSIRNRIGVIIIVVLILSVIIGIAGLSPVIQRLGTLRSPFEPLSFRLDLIKDSLKIIKDFPLWGIGFGALGEIFQKYRSIRIPESFSFSHNEPAQLMAETGIPGFFLIFLFLFFYIKKILALFFRRHNVRVIYITLGCLIGLFSITLHSLFDFVFHVPANALLFCIILALIFRVIYLKEQQNLLPIPKSEMELPFFLKISSVFILLIFLIFAASLVGSRFQAETIFEKVKDYKFSEDSMRAVLEYNKVLKKIDKAIAVNPKNSLYLAKKADIISEFALRQDLKDYLINFENFKDRDSALSLANDYFKEAINLNPTKADFHLRLGWLNSILENKTLARNEFENAILLDPQNTKIKSYVNDYLKDSE